MIKELEREKKEKRMEEDARKEDSIKEDQNPKANLNKTNQKGINNDNKAKKPGIEHTKGIQSQIKLKGKGSMINLANKKQNNNNKQLGSSIKK